VIKEKLGHKLDRWIHTAFPFLFWRPLNPDWLTLFGTVVASGAGIAFAYGAFPLGALLLLAGGFFDLTDGVVARHFGISTRFGAFLDSSLDRVVDMVVMLGLVWFYARSDATGMAIVACTILVATVLTSYAKARAEHFIDHMPGGMLERGERVGLLAAGALFGWMEPVLWLLAVGTVFTTAQRFRSAYVAMGALDAADEAVAQVDPDRLEDDARGQARAPTGDDEAAA